MIEIRPMIAADWPHVERIYAEGIATGHATFEPTTPTWDSFDAGKRPDLRFVAVDSDLVVGWVACSQVSTRDVYRGVVEHSVYVAEAARGRGVGDALLATFIAASEAAGVWTVQSSIFPENEATVRLHQRHGFRVVGTREAIALMTYGPAAGMWRDTLILERRSIGV